MKFFKVAVNSYYEAHNSYATLSTLSQRKGCLKLNAVPEI